MKATRKEQAIKAHKQHISHIHQRVEGKILAAEGVYEAGVQHTPSSTAPLGCISVRGASMTTTTVREAIIMTTQELFSAKIAAAKAKKRRQSKRTTHQPEEQRGNNMALPFEQASKAATYQKAVLESQCGEYGSGTVVYTSVRTYLRTEAPHGGWVCVFPDDSWRVVDNSDLRLCW